MVSGNPPGGVTDAVFTSEPVALAWMVPVTVYVALPPGMIVAVVAMLPEPPAAPQDEPAEGRHVHVAPPMIAGSVSVTLAPTAVDGPAFDTVTV